jgi:cell division transport system permease protein
VRAWLAQHARALRFSLSTMLAAPVSSGLNVLVIGIALSLPSGMIVLLQNVQRLASEAGGSPQISVFLSPDTAREDAARIGRQLKQHDAVDKIEFVPREQALEQLKQSTGLNDVIGGLAQNPLPDAYIVYPKNTAVLALEALRDELRKWQGVEHAQMDSDWARKLEALLKFGRAAVLVLAVLLGSALAAVTFNTIRLQILTRRAEIEVSRLIGATDAFIRRPFLYFGMLHGLLGGVAAWLIVMASLIVVNSSLAETARLYGSSFVLQPPLPRDNLALLAFSACLGWLGAWLSVAQHLRNQEQH